jgi:hypothetical protein
MAERDLTLDSDNDYEYDDRSERRRPLLNLLLLAIVVAAVCFVSAPYFAFRGLRAAAQYRDVAAVAQLVDFNAVRKAMLIDAEPGDPALVTAEPPSIWRDPIGAFKRVLGPIAPTPSEPSVDRFLTIDGLSALTRGYAPGDAPPLPTTPPDLQSRARALIREPMPQIRYWDPNRVRIAVMRPGDGAKTTLFTFERRDWFTWKLVQITLPPGETPATSQR